jgi:hypothetical protein
MASMKAMGDALKHPFRRESGGFVTLRIAPAGTNVSDGCYETSTWIESLRWVKRVMWLLVMVVAFWDLAVTFGPHFRAGAVVHAI